MQILKRRIKRFCQHSYGKDIRFLSINFITNRTEQFLNLKTTIKKSIIEAGNKIVLF